MKSPYLSKGKHELLYTPAYRLPVGSQGRLAARMIIWGPVCPAYAGRQAIGRFHVTNENQQAKPAH